MDYAAIPTPPGHIKYEDKWFPKWDWHSVVILPRRNLTLADLSKYHTTTPGLDIVFELDDFEDDEDYVAKIFPKVTALAGLKKDKRVKKGWFTYFITGGSGAQDKGTLRICTGRSKTYPSIWGGNHGTADNGRDMHEPIDTPIFQVENITITSLHELFCTVEGLLMTL